MIGKPNFQAPRLSVLTWMMNRFESVCRGELATAIYACNKTTRTKLHEVVEFPKMGYYLLQLPTAAPERVLLHVRVGNHFTRLF